MIVELWLINKLIEDTSVKEFPQIWMIVITMIIFIFKIAKGQKNTHKGKWAQV